MNRIAPLFIIVISSTLAACDPEVLAQWRRALESVADYCRQNPGDAECDGFEDPNPEPQPEGNLGGAGFRCAQPTCEFAGMVRVGWIRGENQIIEGSFAVIDPNTNLADELVFAPTPERAPTFSGILDESTDGMWFRPEGDWWWQTSVEEREQWCSQFTLAWYPERLAGLPEWYSLRAQNLTGLGFSGWDCSAGRDGPPTN
ncbi:hypothetical protein H6758_02175 [Candidatus Nomurabacteria bacterium]|nr:hypothetical protein [Candidatus Nomurabacteria bacterium]